MPTDILYQLPEPPDHEQIRQLGLRFHLGPRTEEVRTRTYLDTFDWRLHRAGLRLRLERSPTAGPGERVELQLSSATEPAAHLVVASPPAFADELPPGRLREQLLPVAGVRRLLPVVTVERRSEVLPVLDLRAKTVLRLALDRSTAAADGETSETLPMQLRLAPVRGYEDECAPVALYLESDLQLPRLEADELVVALAAVGRRPGDYSSRLELDLSSEQSAQNALRQVCLRLLATLERNEPGLRQDLDVEFLHDFRVAVRRTRSALGQVKGVLPAAQLEPFRRELAWLGEVTGPKRDLDVLLDHLRREYRQELPPQLLPDLQPLAAFLLAQRGYEQQRLVAVLSSERYRRLLRDWRQFLEQPPAAEPAPPSADRPVLAVARASIHRVARRVLRRIDHLGDDPPDPVLHRLRIHCKKLRYLLEFFRSLFPEEEIRPLALSLRRLQDELGDYQDLTVQQEVLRRYGRELLRQQLGGAGADSRPLADALLAVGFLIARLERRHDRRRQRVLRQLEHFSRSRQRKRIARLFAEPD